MNNGRMSERLMVVDLKAGMKRPVVDEAPVVSSANRGFKGFLLERHRVRDPENLDVAAEQTMIGLHLSDPIKVEIKSDGPFRERTFCPGDVLVFPAGTQYSARCRGSAEFIIMTLDQRLVNDAVTSVHGKELGGRPINWGLRDPFMKEALSGICSAVGNSREVDHLYAESLANSLAMHVARNGEKITGRDNGSDRGLGRSQLDRVLEFINNTPHRDINLNAMAAAAGLSPFHFSRMFKLSTGLSPHQYVLRRRIELATELLRKRELEISRIALDLGFADQSHFTMHFKRQHGMGPATYRRRAIA